jgi:hypothetical protein
VAVVEGFEAPALAAYQAWDREADLEERAALAAFDAPIDESWTLDPEGLSESTTTPG